MKSSQQSAPQAANDEVITKLTRRLQALTKDELVKLIQSFLFLPEAREAMITQLSTPEMEQTILNRYIEKIRELFSPPGFVLTEGGIPRPKSGNKKDFVVISPEEAKANRKAKESVPAKARVVIAEYFALQQSPDLAAKFRRSFAYNCALYMNSFMDEYDPPEILQELYEIFEENYRKLLDYFKVTEIDPYKSDVGFPLSADLESFIDMLVFSRRIPKKKIKELKQAMEEAKKARPQ